MLPVSELPLDSEYQFRNWKSTAGGKWQDIRSQVPLVFSVAAIVQDGEGSYIVKYVIDVRKEETVPYLAQIFQLRVPLVFHYAKAEMFSLWQLGIEPCFPNLYDTWIAAACIHLGLHHSRAITSASAHISDNEEVEVSKNTKKERERLLSLVGQCKYYALDFPSSNKKSKYQEQYINLKPGEALTTGLIEYAADDAEWTLRLYFAQQSEVFRQGIQSHLHHIEFPFAIANARMEWRGVNISKTEMNKLSTASARASAFYGDQLKGNEVNNPASRHEFIHLMEKLDLVHHFHRRTKSGELSTKKEVLEEVEHHHPLITAFLLFNKYRKIASEEWLSGNQIGVDGRIHP